MVLKKLITGVMLLLLLISACSKQTAQENISFAPSGKLPTASAPSTTGKGPLAAKPAAESESAVEKDEEALKAPDGEKPQDAPPEAQDLTYCLSFAGDCTLGTDYDTYGTPGSFIALTGEYYDYAFTYAREYFEDDDFTIVNLECAFTNYTVPEEKAYRFRGPPEYAKILSGSSVECVSLANNHSIDFGSQGLDDTKAALDAENVKYVSNNGTLMYETERGLKIGVCAYFSGAANLASDIKALRDSGAQIVIASFHFGDEGYYTPTDYQRYAAHAAIDAGADIVYGTHPHVLQRIESYGSGVIYYSLGNFSFGGNRNPKDKDTAVIRQYITVTTDGKVTLGETQPVPFRLSSVSAYNDYRPIPYDDGSEEYARVLAKLDGSLVPAPLVNPPASEVPPEATQEGKQESAPSPAPEITPDAPADEHSTTDKNTDILAS